MRKIARRLLPLSLVLGLSLTLAGPPTPAAGVQPDARPGGPAGPVAAAYTGYESLDDGAEQVTFNGTEVGWGGKTWTLDERTIFIDYRLDDAQLATTPHAFRSLQDAKAAGAITSGAIDRRMTVLIAPGVYWIDDPDDGYVRPNRPPGNPEEGLYGMTLESDWLHMVGLNSNKFNVVLAAARGQQQGSDGNFNLMRVISTGLLTENVTFGNYVNVDLTFPLDAKLPAGERLSRPKRFDAISQAQLFGGSRVSNAIAVNTAFISRLNLQPFNALYINCHVESSGHAGGGSTYLNSTLYLYNTNFSGGTQFYNSDIYLEPLSNNTAGKTVYEQGFGDSTSTSGIAIDTRFHRGNALVNHPDAPDMPAGISWATRTPKNPTVRSYQYNVTLDGDPYVIQEHFTPGASVALPPGSDLLKAYRLEHDGQVFYNVQNILGLPNFDGNNAVYLPYANVEAISAAEAADGVARGYYRTVPRTATLAREGASTPIRNGQAAAVYVARPEAGRTAGLGEWSFEAFDYLPDPADAIDPATKRYRPAAYVTLQASGDRVEVSSTLTGYEERQVLIVARNSLGIEAATLATVQPAYLDPPVFTPDGSPEIVVGPDGTARLDYDFEVQEDGLLDTSVISWFRIDGPDDPAPLALTTSRLNKPEREYAIGEGDVGHYLMAEITPKYNVSEAATTTATVRSTRRILRSDLEFVTNAEGHELSRVATTFNNMPTVVQDRILPGTWTRTNGTGGSGWSWADGSTTQGSAGFPGLQTGSPDRQPRLHYQPAGEEFGDVTLTVKLAPNKTAGQGFGSAPDFLDLYLKSDGVRQGSLTRGQPGAMNGYALRFQRLAAPEITELGFNSGGAVAGVAVYLVKVTDGVASAVRYDASGRPFGSTLPQMMWDPQKPEVTYTKGVMTSAYLTEVTVQLALVGGKLSAEISSTADSRPGDEYGYLRQVHLEADVEMSTLGGVGMFYSSSTGSDNSTVLTHWSAEIERLDEPPAPVTIVEAGSGSEFNRIEGERINANANRLVPLADLLGSEFEGISIRTGNQDGWAVVADGLTEPRTFRVYVHTTGNRWTSYDVAVDFDGEAALPDGAHRGLIVVP